MPLQRLLGVISIACLMISASPAGAAAHRVGYPFLDNDSREAGSDGFALGTVDGPPKAAAILANIYMDSTRHQLFIGFANKAQWRKFVALWNAALHSPPPVPDVYKDDTDDYFDVGSSTAVSLSKDRDGGIDFLFFGEPDSGDQHPTVVGSVHLRQTRISEFAQDVRVISAFWDAK